MTLDKNKIIENIFKIGGNHKIVELNECKRQLEICSETDNSQIIRDGIEVINAMVTYSLTGDVSLAREYVSSMWDRLSNKKELEFDEIRMLNIALFYIEDMDEAIVVARRCLDELEKYKSNNRCCWYKTAINLNMSCTLLESKLDDNNYKSKVHDEIFLEFINKALKISKENDIYIAFNVAIIRKGIFLNDNILIYSGLEYLTLKGEEELYKMMKDTIKRHGIVI